MKNISKPKSAKYFMAYDGNGVQHIGRTDTNQVTSTGQPNMIIGDDPDDFLTKTEGLTLDNTNPLPAFGEEVVGGEIYTYNGKLVIGRQTHLRTADEPDTVPALFSTYRVDSSSPLDWIANEQVMDGDIRYYEGLQYVVIQSHTTQADWTPDVVPALFAIYRGDANGAEWIEGEEIDVGETRVRYSKTFLCVTAHVSSIALEPYTNQAYWELVVAEWMQPAGGHDAYQTGHRVTYQGSTYESTINANVWAPDVTGWDLVP